MMKKLISALSITGLALAITPALAQPNLEPVVAGVESPVQGEVATVTIPAHAEKVAENIYAIGTSVDTDGTLLQGYAIVHPKANGAKPDNPGNGKGNGKNKNNDGTSSCYAFLAKGAKWKTAEPYLFNTGNTAGLDSATIRNILGTSLEKWDSAAGVEIFGAEVDGVVDVDSIGNSTNGANEVVFGDIDSAGAIAVTYVWGIFYGNPNNRELREWDMVYDQADFTWNTDGNADDMDFENIATHEIGHAAGLGHPQDDCTEETMYRFAAEGETKKRDLNDGDVAGIVDLYN